MQFGLSTGAGISQLVVLAMTVAKFLTREQGWGRTPMISLMLKEGVTTFILVIGKFNTLSARSLLTDILNIAVSMIAVTSIEFLRDVNVGTERATWAYVYSFFTIAYDYARLLILRYLRWFITALSVLVRIFSYQGRERLLNRWTEFPTCDEHEEIDHETSRPIRPGGCYTERVGILWNTDLYMSNYSRRL